MTILVVVVLLLIVFWEYSLYVENYQKTSQEAAALFPYQDQAPTRATPSATSREDVEVFRWTDDGKP